MATKSIVPPVPAQKKVVPAAGQKVATAKPVQKKVINPNGRGTFGVRG
jgi:hypothetical protein